MKRIRLTAILFLIMIGLVISPTSRVWCAEKISRPFQYSGYSSPEYSSYLRLSSEYVSMSDGTKLAVETYLPSNGASDDQFPVIFNYHPYHRSSIDPATGEIIPYFDQEAVEFFTSYGYAMVFAGMRGSGASYGSRVDMSPQLGKDGRQVVDWIALQSWCDGNVGMMGGSYNGWSQYATSGQKPPALKCIIPELIYLDAFSSALFYPGGIYNKALSDMLNMVFSMRDQNFYAPPPFLPATPVVDEDGDGELTDEIPLDLNANSTFLDDYQLPDNPPQYSDGEERQHIYYQTTLEHLSNAMINEWSKDLLYRDATVPGDYTYTDLGASDFPVGMAESGIAIYNFGGWFDAFPRSTTQWYSTLEATNPSKILIAPINHCAPGVLSGRHPGPYLEYCGIDLIEISNGYNIERLRFVDRYLKGIQNGIDEEAPVYIFVMNGEGWRSEDEWPLARQEITNYYFEEGEALSTVREDEGSDDYVADFTHDSRLGASLANRWNLGLLDNVAVRTDKDLQCLTYTSTPLVKDTEVTGHPIVHLWVSSTADYGDFFVYLEDVDENGDAYLVTDGQLRAGFAGLIPNEDILPPNAGIDVLPDLPWHGYKQADYVDGIFAGANIVELVIDLLPTSWVFKEGHQIRVSIACADSPTFRLHPQLSPTNDPNDSGNIVPTVTVYRDAKHSSHIELPVISETGSGDDICFIATAAYGSSFDSHVKILRKFRDVYLTPSRIGHAFVDLYYRYSPPVACFIAKHKSLQWMMRLSLLPIVGVSWVALNLGSVPTLALMALFLALIIVTTVFLFRRIRL